MDVPRIYPCCIDVQRPAAVRDRAGAGNQDPDVHFKGWTTAFNSRGRGWLSLRVRAPASVWTVGSELAGGSERGVSLSHVARAAGMCGSCWVRARGVRLRCYCSWGSEAESRSRAALSILDARSAFVAMVLLMWLRLGRGGDGAVGI